MHVQQMHSHNIWKQGMKDVLTKEWRQYVSGRQEVPNFSALSSTEDTKQGKSIQDGTSVQHISICCYYLLSS